MKRRAKRDLTALLGVAVLLAAVVIFNTTGQRLKLAKKMVALRIEVEKKRETRGLELLRWSLLLETKGTRRSGPTFSDELEAKDGQKIDIIGFMTPIGTFRNMKEFILLPMPIECYFCQRPPMRDQLLIHMAEGETTNLYKDPMLINGNITLKRGKGVNAFYVVENARLGPGDPEKKATVRYVDPKHMAPHQAQSELQEAIEPPTAVGLEEIEKLVGVKADDEVE